LISDKKLPDDYYELSVKSEGITIKAKGAGTFYALQSLIQILLNHGTGQVLPLLSIEDYPRFAWRGMHLDVARHFMPVDFVKKYIRQIALHKMNIFHWHLTDDQGWRIEIKKYPGLQNISSMRKESMVGHYNEQRTDGLPHGGFYTQDQIREVVAYAASLKITVVPEIEMPGHAMAALAAYPALSCTGGPFNTATTWGVFDDVFCTKEASFSFLENVLDEVIALFPSPYIHIGGDECPKTRWKNCESCQENIRRNGLKDEHELQSWFIRRIEKFLLSKGRKIIGWDEILEGGLADQAAVMSWRGTEGGIAAAKMKHPVVMSPGSHCYFDHYQSDQVHSKVAIGGYNPVNHVYSYEPVPASLNEEEASYIMGAQGNVWTEYMPDMRDVERMAFPRLCALAEVLWTPLPRRDSISFFRRLFVHEPMLINVFDIQSSLSAFSPLISVGPAANGEGLNVSVSSLMSTLFPDLCPCKYSVLPIDPAEKAKPGSLVTYPCSQKAEIKQPSSVSACISVKGSNDCIETPVIDDFDIYLHEACYKTLRSNPPASKYFPGSGPHTLVNGETAVLPRRDKQWNAWHENYFSLLIDLGKPQALELIIPGFLNDRVNGIYTPDSIIFKTSSDTLEFHKRTIANTDIPLRFRSADKARKNRPLDKASIYRPTMTYKNETARFVKIEVYARPTSEKKDAEPIIPWIFMDEVVIKTRKP
jgi:hexosaminidase